ncbi:MAG: DUF308 domain-containing protein [Clostridia bacterium]|nr:DUF308 domain-containing protein [Clostridia bacterium]
MKKENAGNILTYGVMGILGVLLIIFRNNLANTVFKIVGIGLIVAGALGLISALTNKKPAAGTAQTGLVGSAAMVGIGIWLLSNPNGFLNTANFVIGAVVIVVGAMMILQDRKVGANNNMLLGAGLIALGIAVILFKLVAKTPGWAVAGCGIALIVTAASGIIALVKGKN